MKYWFFAFERVLYLPWFLGLQDSFADRAINSCILDLGDIEIVFQEP